MTISERLAARTLRDPAAPADAASIVPAPHAQRTDLPRSPASPAVDALASLKERAAEAMFRMAQLMMRSGRPQKEVESRKIYTELVETQQVLVEDDVGIPMGLAGLGNAGMHNNENFANAMRYEDALKYSERALKLQDREALFHELRGAAATNLDRPADAITSFNRAIAANPDFFRPYLLRGLLHLERGNLEIAEQDLSASNRLLPTADATFGLGDIAQRQGDRDTALRHYAAVAGSNSALAAAARERISRLENGIISAP